MDILAPAKINLHLRVGPPRADGFHPLLTWMCTVGLMDRLTLQKSSAGIQLTCSDPSLPTDRNNLVYRAAELLIDRSTGVAIHLQKQIPHGAGLGGGSSDAATTLRGVSKLFGLSTDLHTLAEMLGSDVPFFLHAPSAICTSRGEIVRPIDRPSPEYALLILPELSLPTPAVYRRFDEMSLGRDENIVDNIDWSSWTRLKADELLPKLVNDLEPAAFSISPELGRLRSNVEQKIGRPVRMSGSGSTLFTLFDDDASAQAAARLIEARHVVCNLPYPHILSPQRFGSRS